MFFRSFSLSLSLPPTFLPSLGYFFLGRGRNGNVEKKKKRGETQAWEQWENQARVEHGSLDVDSWPFRTDILHWHYFVLTILSVARGNGNGVGAAAGGNGGGGGGGQGKTRAYILVCHTFSWLCTRESCRYYEGRTDRFLHICPLLCLSSTWPRGDAILRRIATFPSRLLKISLLLPPSLIASFVFRDRYSGNIRAQRGEGWETNLVTQFHHHGVLPH